MFFTPRHIKEGRHYRHALKRLIHYKSDILREKELAVLQDLLASLKVALKSGKQDQIYAVRDEIEGAVGRIAPPPKDAGWRENGEGFMGGTALAGAGRGDFFNRSNT